MDSIKLDRFSNRNHSQSTGLITQFFNVFFCLNHRKKTGQAFFFDVAILST